MRRILTFLLVVIFSFVLTSCGKEPIIISGEVVQDSAIKYGYFKLETDDSMLFGIKITDETKIDYGTQIEPIAMYYAVDVVCGDEIKKEDDENIAYLSGDGNEKWYYAEKITVTGYCQPSYTDVGFAKPVIYLYPEEETNVTVKLDYNGELTCTYPKSDGTWRVTAKPDGTLIDENGQEYNYLFWEGESAFEFDFSKGFCIKGEDTAEFLETALAELGLTRREANEFIVYWLPLMEANEYNVISFQSENYTEHAKLTVEPTPDTMIRVYIAWYGTDKKIEIEPQELKSPERTGFTVIEWGGSQVR